LGIMGKSVVELKSRGCVRKIFTFMETELAVQNHRNQPLKHKKNPALGHSLYNGSYALKKGHLVGRFSGTIIAKDDMPEGEEAVYITKNLYLLRPPIIEVEGCAWYCNASTNRKDVNCTIVTNNKIKNTADRAFLRTIMDIKPAEELIVSYGSKFWKSEMKKRCALPEPRTAKKGGRNLSTKKTQRMKLAEKRD